MKREDFKQIIKLRSVWKIDRRKGNYKLPDGKNLREYVESLVESEMKLDHLGIRENGDLCFCTGGEWNDEAEEFDNYTLIPNFEGNETCSREEMDRRIRKIINEIVG